jgi:cytochrome P450
LNRRLTHYTGIIQDEVDRSLADWARKGTVDLFRECSRLAIAIMARCLMGDDVIERFPKLGDLYREFEGLGALPAVAQFSWFPSGASRRFKKVR